MSGSTVRSLHSLCVENQGFAVRPLFWTRNHLSILKCEFHQIDDVAANPLPPKFESWIVRAIRKLAYGLDPHGQIDSIFLNQDTPLRVAQRNQVFRYGRFKVKLPQCFTFSIEPSTHFTTQSDSVVGYYMYDAYQKRRDLLRPPPAPWGRNNDPVKRKYDRRYRLLTPDDWRKDPYLLFLLVGMAQYRWGHGLRAALVSARLLVTIPKHQKHATVFKIEVPRQLLESLDDPLRSIEDFDFPAINYTKVPFKPYSTFQERVNPHFGIMGPCGDTTTPRGEKRKCQDAGSSPSKVPKTDLN